MSSEKRLFLFLALTFASILGIQYLMDVTGLNPPPPQKKFQDIVAQAKKGDGGASRAEKGKVGEKEKSAEPIAEKRGGRPPAEAKPEPPKPRVALADPAELVLGSEKDHTPRGY